MKTKDQIHTPNYSIFSIARKDKHVIRHGREALGGVFNNKFVHQTLDHCARADPQRLFPDCDAVAIGKAVLRMDADDFVRQVPKA